MGLIPDDVIDEIRARADIVSIIGQHVSLRKAGRNHKGLCPFHGEKTPSFNVNPDRQFFYCFGCQKKGDVFTFVMEYEGKSFVEAAEALAGRAGVAIPERRESPVARRQRSERTRLLEVNQLASEFFQQTLGDEQRGAAGRSYLESRGVGREMARAFRLGYAADAWTSLAEYLANHRIPTELAVTLGLLAPRKRGGYYDRFRHRVICPVILPGGDIAGFSGRLLPGADEQNDGRAPKYYNSPESPVYKKSKLLFGLHLARDGFRRSGRAILVEGNFDVISMHQAGFTETTAPLGTALTDQQVDSLRRLADRVVLLYDGDAAGQRATLKALEALVEADVTVEIAVLPRGDDPDSILARGGSDQMAAILDRTRPGIEYFIDEVWVPRARSSDGHAAALADAAKIVRKVADPTKRDLITGRLAVAMDVPVPLVTRAFARNLHDADRPNRRQGPAQADRREPAPSDDGRARTRLPPPPEWELKLLAILADHPQLMTTAEEHDVVSLLTDGRLRDMYCAARQGSPLLSAAPDDISPLIAKHVFAGSYAKVEDPTHCLLETVASLRSKRGRQRLLDLQRRIEEARRQGDDDLQRELIREQKFVRETLTTRRQVD